jgi:hypothetical protein
MAADVPVPSSDDASEHPKKIHGQDVGTQVLPELGNAVVL